MLGAAGALGLERHAVRLTAHDARWRVVYEQERGRLLRTLGHLVLGIEHIGSTEVPGLPAKPVIDLMIGVADTATRVMLIEPLQRAGYVHRDSDVISGRLHFKRDDAHGLRTHQASVCAMGGVFWREHLAFRDTLRADAALREAYLRLEQSLAARYPDDRVACSDAKSEFVGAVLRGAVR
jgi:GrpB-like predicted nucleotidyltransferase (UPF0157 family)